MYYYAIDFSQPLGGSKRHSKNTKNQRAVHKHTNYQKNNDPNAVRSLLRFRITKFCDIVFNLGWIKGKIFGFEFRWARFPSGYNGSQDFLTHKTLETSTARSHAYSTRFNKDFSARASSLKEDIKRENKGERS
jgi:hypothetical protein